MRVSADAGGGGGGGGGGGAIKSTRAGTHIQQPALYYSQHCRGDDICVVSVVRPGPHGVSAAAPQ